MAICVALGGCERKDPAPQRNADTNPAPDIDIDALRSLPYAGSYAASSVEPAGVVFRDAERSCPGYDLCSIQMLSRAELIDEQGAVIRVWQYAPSQTWENCELLPNGDLLVVGADPHYAPDGRPLTSIGDDCRYVLRFNWAGELLWKRQLRAHHDIELTADGNLLLLAFERRRVPRVHSAIPVRDDQLMLLDPDGTVLVSRSMLDAVARNSAAFPLKPVKPSALGGPPWVDIFHSNSVEWMHHEELVGRHRIYDLSNVLLCFRHQDCVAVFDWQQGEFIWSWGQNLLSGPHDAHTLANGHILLFDNGLGRGVSRAIELDPLSGRIVWQYQGSPPPSFYTATKGSVQRLPNGNTLLAESDKGQAIEVTPDGTIVWKFVCPHRVESGERAAIVRVKRHPREEIARIMHAHQE